MYEEIVYYVACPRKDGTQPEFVKACDEIFYLDKERAQTNCNLISHELGVQHEVYEAKVTYDI